MVVLCSGSAEFVDEWKCLPIVIRNESLLLYIMSIARMFLEMREHMGKGLSICKYYKYIIPSLIYIQIFSVFYFFGVIVILW